LDRQLKFIGATQCRLYGCKAYFYIERTPEIRNLVVQYGSGYAGRNDLPIAANGLREFTARIPSDWTEQELLELLLNPQPIIEETEHLKNYPVWEAGARYFGSPYLCCAD